MSRQLTYLISFSRRQLTCLRLAKHLLMTSHFDLAVVNLN